MAAVQICKLADGREPGGGSTPSLASCHPGRCPGSTMEGSAPSAYPRTMADGTGGHLHGG
jgi:hypothetical protein